MKPVALLLLLTFGCATIRSSGGALSDDPPPASGIVAEPQVELWLESSDPIKPAESSQAVQASREALQKALAGRSIAPGPLGAQDPLLVVRERAVARTDSRKTDQRLAYVGIALGIVVVVAVIVVAVVASGKSNSGPTVHAPPPSAGHAAAHAAGSHAPVAHPPRLPRPPAPPRVPAPAPVAVAHHFAPREYYFYNREPDPFFWLDLGLQLSVPPEPLVLVDRPPDEAPLLPGAPPPDSVVAEAEPTPPEPEPEQPAPPPELQLPAPPEIDMSDRGFFSSEETAIELDLCDRSTGQVLWTKVVRGDADPRDPGDVRKLINQALDSQGWAPRLRR